MCGDVELNPGPDNNGTAMSVLNVRLARIGLAVINIVSDGNCLFRSVSYQLYKTETYHTQIRAVAIQHLINCPEQFIESNTEQSWMQYLQNMSSLGTCADNIIIQAVANAHNLIIHIIESAQNFAESTVVSPVYTKQGQNSRHIYIGHVDEMHYVSTSPIIRNQTVSAQSANKQNNTTPTQIMDTLKNIRIKFNPIWVKSRPRSWSICHRCKQGLIGPNTRVKIIDPGFRVNV